MYLICLLLDLYSKSQFIELLNHCAEIKTFAWPHNHADLFWDFKSAWICSRNAPNVFPASEKDTKGHFGSKQNGHGLFCVRLHQRR